MNPQFRNFRVTLACICLLVGYSCSAPEKAKNEAAAPLAISEIEAEIKNYISQTT